MIKWLVPVLLFPTVVLAHYNGPIDPTIHKWFEQQRSPTGVPCCDVADGHATTWRASKTPGYDYEVPINGKWIPIPPEAVIRGKPNPTGSSIVWYTIYGDGEVGIYCFILGAGS